MVEQLEHRTIEDRVASLEAALQQLVGMAKLLKWFFAILLFLGVGPIVTEKIRQLLTALARL